MVKAGTQLLFTRAPPIPPSRIPKQMIVTESANKKGAGPDNIILATKKNAPIMTMYLKFLLFSGIKLSTKEVKV